VFSKAEEAWAERYFRATNYIAASAVYLKNNFLLERPLKPSDIKESLLGHWGTCPGINFIYTHLNLLASKRGAKMLLLTGPGHGFAANLANLYLEGSLHDKFPEYAPDRAGLGNLIKSFCWPCGFPSHLNPGVPGCIHEGGELGYALATAFGAVFDNPDLIAVCVVGDGEAETGPTATAWHSTKFLDPKTSGAVLPILHLNRYKINSPTIYGTMTRQELTALFKGYGYAPRFVGTKHRQMALALEWAHAQIRKIQNAARKKKMPARPRWPMLILESPKGWTGIKRLHGKRIEGSYRSHQVPTADVKTNPESLKALEAWLRSYRPHELFPNGAAHPDVLRYVPKGDLRLGSNPHALGGNMRVPLKVPDLRALEVKMHKRGDTLEGSMSTAGKLLREVMRLNPSNFRIFSPDELASNKLDAVLDVTGRAYVWPHDRDDDSLRPDGKVMEMLSEHTLQAWMQGYVLTGRHGLFPSYEAFVPIVDSMVSQYLKFIDMSLNYILTSVCWRQDHNGFSHQNPGFVNMLLNKAKEEQLVRIYLPPDSNVLLSTLDHALRSANRVNVIVADKRPIRQWLSLKEAIDHCRVGASVWEFASDKEPDVVLAAAGDYQTQESLAAIQLLRELAPDLRVRFVNVTELNVLGEAPFYPNSLDDGTFTALFPEDRQVVFSFHGYPGAIKQLLFDRKRNERFHVYGYIEKGTTTTPFDMLVRNNVSRYHLAVRAIKHAAAVNARVASKANLLSTTIKSMILEHRAYILEHGADPPEIGEWAWKRR
jgi:xylulose-5-phosphate/fructose-6-phosphate phosphoketolase